MVIRCIEPMVAIQKYNGRNICQSYAIICEYCGQQIVFKKTLKLNHDFMLVFVVSVLIVAVMGPCKW